MDSLDLDGAVEGFGPRVVVAGSGAPQGTANAQGIGVGREFCAGVLAGASGDEEHAEAVVVAVAEAAGDAAVEFDEAVDGFGAAVAGAAGVEVGQERGLPAAQGLAEPGDLGNGAGRERVGDLLGESPARGGGRGVVDGPDLLRAVPGEGHLVVAFVRVEGSSQARALPGGETVGAGVQEVADAVERITLPSAVSVDLLLHPATDLVQRLGGEGDDVKGIQDRDG